MQAENYAEKESWIGALGKAMIKPSVMIDDDMDDKYMWIINQCVDIHTISCSNY